MEIPPWILQVEERETLPPPPTGPQILLRIVELCHEHRVPLTLRRLMSEFKRITLSCTIYPTGFLPITSSIRPPDPFVELQGVGLRSFCAAGEYVIRSITSEGQQRFRPDGADAAFFQTEDTHVPFDLGYFTSDDPLQITVDPIPQGRSILDDRTAMGHEQAPGGRQIHSRLPGLLQLSVEAYRFRRWDSALRRCLRGVDLDGKVPGDPSLIDRAYISDNIGSLDPKDARRYLRAMQAELHPMMMEAAQIIGDLIEIELGPHPFLLPDAETEERKHGQ